MRLGAPPLSRDQTTNYIHGPHPFCIELNQSYSRAPPCCIEGCPEADNSKHKQSLLHRNDIMDIDETCPICFWYSKAVKGNRSQVNRHLKEYAVKDDPKGHPRMGTVEFEELMASRRCFTASRDKHEQARTRKARNQRYRNNHPELKRTIRVKSQQKSASRGLPSRQKTMTPQSRIDEAFAKLR